MQERVESRERDKIILQHPFYQGEFYHQILMDATAFGEEAFTGTSAERRRLICIGLRGRFSGQVEGVAQPRGQLRKSGGNPYSYYGQVAGSPSCPLIR